MKLPSSSTLKEVVHITDSFIYIYLRSANACFCIARLALILAKALSLDAGRETVVKLGKICLKKLLFEKET